MSRNINREARSRLGHNILYWAKWNSYISETNNLVQSVVFGFRR